METNESLQWLKENNLYELAKSNSSFLKRIFSDCLDVKDEKVLIIGDRGSKAKKVAPVLAGSYYLAAEELKLNTKFVLQGAKSRGMNADDDVISSLESLEEGSAIFFVLSDKLGSINSLGKSFRELCKKRKFKFVSALSLGDLKTSQLQDVISPIDINYKPMQLQQEQIKKLLDEAMEIRITTKAGTDLYYNVTGMKAISADGNYHVPGTGGNLPAGEVYIPPNSKRVEGKVVIDGSSRTHRHTVMIKDTITLSIEDGNVTSIEGKEEAKQLERTLEWASSKSKHPGSVRRICELGIGFNPKARIIGSMLVDEKTLGTAHIGIGSNYWFGGNIYAIIHLDQVFKEPVIEVDGKVLT